MRETKETDPNILFPLTAASSLPSSSSSPPRLTDLAPEEKGGGGGGKRNHAISDRAAPNPDPGLATTRRAGSGSDSRAAAAVIRAGNALPQAAGRGYRVPARGGGGGGGVVILTGGCEIEPDRAGDSAGHGHVGGGLPPELRAVRGRVGELLAPRLHHNALLLPSSFVQLCRTWRGSYCCFAS
jgi:hypothetical protein